MTLVLIPGGSNAKLSSVDPQGVTPDGRYSAEYRVELLSGTLPLVYTPSLRGTSWLDWQPGAVVRRRTALAGSLLRGFNLKTLLKPTKKSLLGGSSFQLLHHTV